MAALLVGVLGAAAAALLLIAFGGKVASDRAHTAARPPVHRVVSPPWLVARGVGTLGSPVEAAAAASLDSHRTVLLGGLTPAGASRSEVTFLRDGAVAGHGALPTALHDAAAGALGGRVYLFGGGDVASTDRILRVGVSGAVASPAGRLPQPRSDLASAVVGDTAYLVGGFTGMRALTTILAWRPGGSARVVARLPRPLRYSAVAAIGRRVVIAGGTDGHRSSRDVYVFDAQTRALRRLGRLPLPLSHAAAATYAGYVYVIGGRTVAGRPSRDILAIDVGSGRVSRAGMLPSALADTAAVGRPWDILVAGGRSAEGARRDVLSLATRRGGSPSPPAVLRAGSDPRALPGNVLIADRGNNRLLEVSPHGAIVWRFPRRGDLRHGEHFRVPDDAFFSRDGRLIYATQEDDFTISVIDVASHRIVFRYGKSGQAGFGANRLHNPDDALPLPDGSILAADIKNCRVIRIDPHRHRAHAQAGRVGRCEHAPPSALGSPNGAFPLRDGGTVITEIAGDWADVLDRNGRLRAAVHPPGFTYPSDTNEIRRGLYLSADYTIPGAIEAFDQRGARRWRFAPTGRDALAQPSLALPLQNGDVIANDDANHRVIVIDPRRRRIVWQYGSTGKPGRRAGLLNTPDGVDLAPPHQLTRIAGRWQAP
jgi:DNA-binding beta-propeller fold protein YncE